MLSQAEIEEIILFHSCNISQRMISKSLGHSRRTVAKYTDSVYLARVLGNKKYQLKKMIEFTDNLMIDNAEYKYKISNLGPAVQALYWLAFINMLTIIAIIYLQS